MKAACRHCDRVRPIRHRGLCAACYSGYRHLYPRAKRAWTTGDVRALVAMRGARATRKEIAAALGRTANAVSRRLARLSVLKGRPAERRAG